MAYPNGTPSSGITDIYQGTAFTPLSTTQTIRDNYTSIDKASLANSLGTQIALIQNFVNSTYLGRASTPVGTIYGNNVLSSSALTISGSSLVLREDSYYNSVRINEGGVTIYGDSSAAFLGDSNPDILLNATSASTGDIVLWASDQIDIIAGRHSSGHGPLNLLNTYDQILIQASASGIANSCLGNYTIESEAGKYTMYCSGLVHMENKDPGSNFDLVSNRNMGLQASGSINLTAVDAGTGGYPVINLLADKETNVRSKCDVNIYAGYTPGTSGSITMTADDNIYMNADDGNMTLEAGATLYLITGNSTISVSGSLPTSSAGLSTGDLWISGAGRYLMIA